MVAHQVPADHILPTQKKQSMIEAPPGTKPIRPLPPTTSQKQDPPLLVEVLSKAQKNKKNAPNPIVQGL
jgi:hypothetical protein